MGQLHLGLDASDRQAGETGGEATGGLEQRGLAHAWLAVDEQHAGAALRSRGHELGQTVELLVAPHQPAGIEGFPGRDRRAAGATFDRRHIVGGEPG